MSITSATFILILLPLFLLLYYLIVPVKNIRKGLILLANSIFYFWGGGIAILGIMAIGFLTWGIIWLASRTQKKWVTNIGIIIVIIPLIVAKYSDFILENLSGILHFTYTSLNLIVPLGLSFFTFQAVALICDRKKCVWEKEPSLIDVYLYLSFFPTVTSGPIVRYHQFEEGLTNPLSSVRINRGIERIAIGLCKKVLIADKISFLADYYFNGIAGGNSFSTMGLWIGSVTYSLQLYFDFSGYSDMAIGIATLMGFDIPENFNLPYCARSIKDFWRRWHISLSTWFRDYIYIPLGGNRCSSLRNGLNLLIVWLLTGIWHGADWSFVIWGMGYFVLLLIEKKIPFMQKIGDHWYGHVYALFFINLLWIPFRSSSISVAVQYIRSMFIIHGGIEPIVLPALPILLVAVSLCLPWKNWLKRFEKNKSFQMIRGMALCAVTVIALCSVLNATYSPYIYGNF